MKTCKICGETFENSTKYFYKNGGLKCKKCSNEISRAWRHNNPEAVYKIKKRQRLKKLGFSLELFDNMFKSQGNVCALCNAKNPGGQGWTADHDHNTGKARGILCFSCNTTLGHIEAKDSDWLNKAQKYIEQGGFFSDNSQEIVTQS